MQALRIGDVEIVRVEELIWEVPHTFFFPDLPGDALAPHAGWLAPRFFTPDGRLRLSIHSFVVKTPHHTVVVDTCVGNHKSRPVERMHMLDTDYPARLRRHAGIAPHDVDYVLCTHFHVDHVGWNTTLVNGRWEPTFPNARYLFHRPEFDYVTSLPADQRHPCIADSVLPIAEAGRAELVDGEHAIGDRVFLEPTPGHTPGHCSVRIDTPQGAAVISGDLFHTPAQVVETHWKTRLCVDGDLGVKSRREFIARHAEAGSRVLGTHFAPPTACLLQPHGDGFRPVFDA